MRHFIRNWALPLSILTGVLGYLLCVSLSLPACVERLGMGCVMVLQPVLIFLMLFITFCKIDPAELRLRRWHGWLILFQVVSFLLLAVVSMMVSQGWKVVFQGAMLCMICPTATAAAVVTVKLGGSAGRVTAYTTLVNLVVAFVFSAVVPFLRTSGEYTFMYAFLLIVCKVFPLLFLPIVAAVCARRCVPSLPEWLKQYPDLAFNLWIVALTIAIGVTMRSISHSHYHIEVQVLIAVASAVACAVQFAFGRWIGKKEGDAVTAGQALGQKNTVVAIWLGATFLDPITSIAGGFYSVWHNVFNAYQLQKHSS